MVLVTGYSVDALVAQVFLTYALVALTVLVFFLRSHIRRDGAWIGKWYWALLVITVVETGCVLFYFTPIRIGEVMMVNGMLFGMMVAGVLFDGRS